MYHGTNCTCVLWRSVGETCTARFLAIIFGYNVLVDEYKPGGPAHRGENSLDGCISVAFIQYPMTTDQEGTFQCNHYISAVEYQDERVRSTRLCESLRFKEVLCRAKKITPLLVQSKHISSKQFISGTLARSTCMHAS